MGEILQLRVDDVDVQDGVNCIKVRETEDRTLKTKASRRTIPIHPELEGLGFLEYVANARKISQEDLFVEATKGWRW